MLCMCVCASRRQALKTEILNEVLPINRITLNLDEFDSIPKPDTDCSWSLYSAQVGDVALKILGPHWISGTRCANSSQSPNLITALPRRVSGPADLNTREQGRNATPV
jgi:hypothetical protein